MADWLAVADAAGSIPTRHSRTASARAARRRASSAATSTGGADYRGPAAAFTVEPELAELLVGGRAGRGGRRGGVRGRARRRASAAPPLESAPGPVPAAPPVEARAGSGCAVSPCSRWRWSCSPWSSRSRRSSLHLRRRPARGRGRRARGRRRRRARRYAGPASAPPPPSCSMRCAPRPMSRSPGSNIGPTAASARRSMLDSPATLAALQPRIEASGLAVEAGEPRNAGGRAGRRSGAAAGMMEGVAPWWRERTQREQRLLLVMFALLAWCSAGCW